MQIVCIGRQNLPKKLRHSEHKPRGGRRRHSDKPAANERRACCGEPKHKKRKVKQKTKFLRVVASHRGRGKNKTGPQKIFHKTEANLGKQTALDCGSKRRDSRG